MVRRTSTRLGLRTDSSQRFEKTLDSQLCERTLLRTLELILELCPEAKVVGKIESILTESNPVQLLKIKTSKNKINSVLGINLSDERLKNILLSLDFQIQTESDSLVISVPTYRATKDIQQEADLIEEVGRIVGYDNIHPMSPLEGISPVKLTELQKVHRRVRDFMVMQGKSFEVMSYPLIGETLLKKTSWGSSTSLKLINSLSLEHNLMRPSLIPSLLEVSELNSKNLERFRLFELGRAYTEDAKTFAKESSHLGAVFFDKDKNQFIEMTNTVSNLLSSLNLSFDFVERNPKFNNPLVPFEWIGNHPFEFLNIRVMGKFVGAIFTVHPLVLRNLKIKGHLTFCIFDFSLFDNYSSKDKTKYKALNKFPHSTFDWTVVVGKDKQISDVVNSAKKFKPKELQSLEVLDIFPGENIKYVTLRAVLADDKATLSSEILKIAEAALIEGTTKAGFLLK
jgi:phenylalanyl-tRNA synthetase beta chain